MSPHAPPKEPPSHAARAAPSADPNPSAASPPGAQPPRRGLRRWMAPVAALALTAWIVSRIDFRTFASALSQVALGPYALLGVGFVFALLTADAFATLGIYRPLAPKLGFRELWVLRGASYLPSLVNHHVGQAYLTVVLSQRHGVPLGRVAGATLLGYASWAGALLGIGAAGVLLSGRSLAWVVGIVAAGLGYLALLTVRPASLAKRAVLAPLFEAGVSGHLVALAQRLPHVAVMFAGTWLPLELFGVHVPLGDAVALLPLVMMAGTLPITPQGAGTRDAVAMELLARFAPGTTVEEQAARVAASTTSFIVLITLVELALGVVLARRMGAKLTK
jgi:hypothetical protein